MKQRRGEEDKQIPEDTDEMVQSELYVKMLILSWTTTLFSKLFFVLHFTARILFPNVFQHACTYIYIVFR